MSGKLNPSKSTVYVSNLPFSLTNNDLHTLFEEYGKVVKVTVVKNENRKSKGVAFVLFLNKEDARKSAREINGKEVYGRTIKASIAVDNGRSTEFIRKRTYKDKTFCYECGKEGHLSYKCPKNALGDREPPKKKIRPRKPHQRDEKDSYCYDSADGVRYFQTLSEDESLEPDVETLSAAIKMEQEKYSSSCKSDRELKKRKIKQSSYFSDEEDISD